MMGFTNIFDVVKEISEAGAGNTARSEADYLDDDGLLVCGVCGERKEEIMYFANPSEENLDRQSPLKVTCACRCDREREAARRDSELIQRLREASLLDKDERFKSASFDKFEVNKFNERNLKLCKRYVERFDQMVEKNQGLLFWGGFGTGKTYAASCIANELINKKIPVIMISVVKLLELIMSREENDVEILRKMGLAKLVIFDELGAQRGTEYALEKVYSIIDGRYRQKLPSIFTTNLSLKEMETESDVNYGRIYDRIFETCFPMQFTGTSWRRKEAGKRYAEMEQLLND